MHIFVLDDSSQRHELFKTYLDGATVAQARTASEAYTLLRHQRFDALFFDHDLEMSGPQCGSGTEVVTAIAMLVRMGMYPSKDSRHCVHSMNLERAEYMFKVLTEAQLPVSRCAEAWTEEQALSRLANAGEWALPERWTSPLEFGSDD